MSKPKLINFMKQAPFLVYKNEGIEFQVFTAQNLYIDENYVARNFDYFENKNSSVLYLMTTISSNNKDFVFYLPKFDKRFVKEWSKEQWVELAYLLHRKDKVQTDMNGIQEVLTNMSMFNDMRKNAKLRQKELKQEVKSVDRNIQQFLANAREKGNEKIVFGE